MIPNGDEELDLSTMTEEDKLLLLDRTISKMEITAQSSRKILAAIRKDREDKKND